LGDVTGKKVNKQLAAGEFFQKLHRLWQFLSTFPAIWHKKINRQPAAGENFLELHH
jgi:hypothetical protein